MTKVTGGWIGPYEIVEWLGAGGMGTVYRARDPRLNRDVAIKVISGAGAADPVRVRRFEHEAQITGRLNHPNILAVYDIGIHEGAPYLVSELLEGESLRAHLLNGALSVRKTIDYARQTADGLAAAHDKGIVHRDIKPENLFVTPDGRIKILDFGVAKLSDRDDNAASVPGSATETLADVVVGTAAYMSPEQVRGETVDVRSDIFSLGAVLYEMLTGSPAFARRTAADTMAAVLKENPADGLSEQISPALRHIVARCLEKDRALRFQSSRDLTFGLQYLSGSSDMPAVAGNVSTALWRGFAIATIVLIVLAAVVRAWILSPTEKTADEYPLANADFIPITNADAMNRDAAISPDGASVAFISSREGPFHAMVKVGSGATVDLTPGAENQENPNGNRSVGFSPDGSMVWLCRNTDPHRPLRFIPVTGGGEAQPFLSGDAINVAWSADGSRLAYFTYAKGDPLFVADGRGENPKQIHVGAADEHNHFPVWSMNGEWIYYVHSVHATAADIWRVGSTGGPPERVTHLNTEVKYLAVIDARTILFVAPDERRAGPWLWALDVNLRTARRATIGLERYLSISASADGRRLAATRSLSSASLSSVPITSGRVAGEEDVKPYATDMPRALAPRFGGGSLFFLSSTGPGDGLWRMRDGAPEEIWKGSDGALLESPSVSPDGQFVAILLRSGGRRRLNVQSADGRTRRSLADSIDPHGTSSWSPDSKSIVTGGTDATGPGLFRIPADGGLPVVLTRGTAFDPIWSPTEDQIIYVAGQNTFSPLRAITAEGNELPFPEFSFGPGGSGRARFTPDGKAIVYVHGSPGAQNFSVLDLKTKRHRQITRLANRARINTFDITPDGRRIVFDRIREDSEVVLINRRK